MNRFLISLCVALWAAVVIWAGVIFYFSSLSGSEIERIAPGIWDKGAHFVAFFAGGVLLSAALAVTRRWPVWKTIAAATVALSIYGGLDEWRQLYTPGRFGADKKDWLADTLGAFCGASAFSLLYARRNSRTTAPAPARD